MKVVDLFLNAPILCNLLGTCGQYTVPSAKVALKVTKAAMQGDLSKTKRTIRRCCQKPQTNKGGDA